MEEISREERKDSNLFLGIQNLEEVEYVKDDLAKLDPSASVLNPNNNMIGDTFRFSARILLRIAPYHMTINQIDCEKKDRKI